MKDFSDKVNLVLTKYNLLGKENQKHNHFIITKYKNEKDNIGFHNDKDRDFEPGSWVVIVKFGEARKFEFQYEDKTFWSKKLDAGTAIFLNYETNRIIKHGVPDMKEKVGMSGSVVTRSIKTVIPWDTVHKNIEKSNKLRNKNKKE